MIMSVSLISRETIVKRMWRSARGSRSVYIVPRDSQGGMQVAQGLTHLGQGQRRANRAPGCDKQSRCAHGRLSSAFDGRRLCAGVKDAALALECGAENVGRGLVCAMSWLVQRSVIAAKARLLDGVSNGRWAATKARYSVG